MNTLGRLLCFLGVHKPHDGFCREWSLYWSCSRCGAMQRGGMGQK